LYAVQPRAASVDSRRQKRQQDGVRQEDTSYSFGRSINCAAGGRSLSGNRFMPDLWARQAAVGGRSLIVNNAQQQQHS